MGGKGTHQQGPARTGWHGIARKRCQFPKCKKRARHEMSNDEVYCRKHARGDE